MTNDFLVDTSKHTKKDFLKRIRIPLSIALLLTGVDSLSGLYFISDIIFTGWWADLSPYHFGTMCLHYLSVICIFISLIKMICDAKPFSHSLTFCIRIIAVFLLISSVLFPRLSGFDTNFEIFSYGGFTLIDGNFLVRGVLLFIFSIILHEGFSMQKDIEETL